MSPSREGAQSKICGRDAKSHDRNLQQLLDFLNGSLTLVNSVNFMYQAGIALDDYNCCIHDLKILRE